jgi:hypothetical protein
MQEGALMLDMDLGSGECGGYAGGDVLLAAPQRLVRQVLTIIREGDGFAVHASVAKAAAGAGGSRQAVVPIRRQPTRMRDNASR